MDKVKGHCRYLGIPFPPGMRAATVKRVIPPGWKVVDVRVMAFGITLFLVQERKEKP
jgi:hypothetical protein